MRKLFSLLSAIFVCVFWANAQNLRTVRGTVMDEFDDVLPGCAIYVSGTSNGVFTDMSGRYIIDVPDDPAIQLVFEFIGMRQQIVAIGDKKVIDIIMRDDTHMLDQIVVTGYQTISRERSAGSFASVSGDQVRDQANIHGNILRSLEGSAAGLSVTESADGVNYIIRGISSINSKREPLFIVDGVAMTKDQVDKLVNPNDIENISFLKDATAASIWGAQAANGVVVMSTKSGKNGNLSISYNGSFSFKGKPDWSYMDLMTSEQFLKTAAEVFDPQTYKWADAQNTVYGVSNGDYRVVYPHEFALYRYFNGEISLAERDAAIAELARVDGRKEYEKYFMSNAYLMNHSVSFSGGNEISNLYASLESQREQGSYQDISDEYRIFLRDIIKPAPWLTLDLSVNAFFSTENSHESSYRVSDLPYVSFFGEDGKELSHSKYVMTDAYRQSIESVTGINLDYYPVNDFRSSLVKRQSHGVNANAGLTVKLAKWLRYEGRFQYSQSSVAGENFFSGNDFMVRLERAQGTDNSGTQYLPSSGGHFTSSNSSVSSYTVRNQINLDRDLFGDGKHRITGIAGFEFSSRKNGRNETFMRGYDIQTMQHIYYDAFNLNMTGVKNPALQAFSGSSTNTFAPDDYRQSEMEYRFISMYANGAYSLLDKYSLNASVRVDQSNLFGSDPSVQFKPIWSTGVIWNTSKEDFMDDAKSWLSRLNLRASFGYAGNSPDPGQGGPYNILASVADPNYSQFGLGYHVVTPANDKLSWEKTRTLNLGVDWAVLGNRISGEIDVYDKLTSNLLAQAPVDPTTGFTTVLSNVGTMTNKGIEFTVNSTNISTDSFEWTTDFNISYNANKLVEMYVEPPTAAYAMISYNYWEGYPFGTVFAYRWAGLDPADGMPRVFNTAGDIVRSITDVDSEDAVRYMGTTVPPVFGSLNNSLRWGNWDLSFSFIYNFGHVLRNDVNRTFSYRLGSNLHNDFSKRWKQPGDESKTDIPAYYSLKNSSINESDITYLYKYADINVLDASYIKLREVSMGYRLPSSACRHINAQSAMLRLQASNLATFAFNGEGIDPEAFYLSAGSRADRFKPFVSASLNIEF